ncbi:MAG: DUF2905 family protein [Burkholderiales bacterium]
MVTLLVVLFVLGVAAPLLAKFGLGRLPGDLQVEHHGRKFHFPFATSIILSLLLTLLLWAV